MKQVEELLQRKIFNDIDKTKITERHKFEINKLLEVFNGDKIKNRLKNIHDFIKYNVDGCWLNRINIIINNLKNDIASDYALEIRYGKENINLVKQELYPKFTHSLEKYINSFGKIDGQKKWAEYLIKSKTPWGLNSCIEKYGEEEGEKKWVERLSKKVKTQSQRKRLHPYKNGRTLVEYQERYGIKDGFQKWLERNRKQKYRFSKDFYIKKYGEIEGNERWFEYKKNMNKTSLNAFVERYGKEIGLIKHNEHLNKLFNSGIFYSKISQELFWLLYNKLNNSIIKFAELNGEEIIYANNTTILIDFKCGDKIIEFDGDYWHNKPKQIEKDKLRDDFLINKGYKILRIKESEYLLNKELTVIKCIKFLNNET